MYHGFTPGEVFETVDSYGTLKPGTLGADMILFGATGLTATVAANAVTLNARKGVITDSAVLNAGAGTDITLTNSFITTSSVILLTVNATTATAAATRDAITVDFSTLLAGSVVIHLYNGDAANTSAACKINFMIL